LADERNTTGRNGAESKGKRRLQMKDSAGDLRAVKSARNRSRCRSLSHPNSQKELLHREKGGEEDSRTTHRW